MPYVRTRKQRGQISHQPETPDRSPVNVFNCAAVDGGLRSNHHFTASVLAIAKGDEQTAAVICFAIGTKWERATMQPCERNEHSHEVTGLAQKFNVAIGQSCDVGGETHVECIDVINGTAGMIQPNDVTRPGAFFENCGGAEFRKVGSILH